MANEYATLAELKTQLRITNTADDTELQSKLTAASRRVDRDTGRRFYLDSGVSARAYPLTHDTKLIVDDFSTTTGLIVQVGNGTSWSTVDASQYRVAPRNNIADGKAAYLIERVFSCWPLGVYPEAQITAKWGWPAIPDEIKAATLLVAARLFRRKDSPEGIRGSNDLGFVRLSRQDPDYDALIGPYVRPEI